MFDVDLEVIEGIALALHAVGEELFDLGKHLLVWLVGALLPASLLLLFLLLLAAGLRSFRLFLLVYLFLLLVLLEVLLDLLDLLLQPALSVIIHFLKLLLVVV